MRTRAVRAASRRQKNSVRHAIAETQQETAADHVLHLKRLKAYDPGRARGYVIQLQRQYGNQYVQRVIDVSKGGAAAQPLLGGMKGMLGGASSSFSPEVALEKALILAEVPVEEMKTILARMGMSLADIATNPLGFMRNLLGTLRLAFGQFFGNIRENMVGGMVEWLAGSLEESGVKMPDDFDFKGIFMVAAQVMNITAGTVRGKLGNVLGGTPTAFIEQVWGRMQGGLNDGPAGIWNLAKGQLMPVMRSMREILMEFAISQPLTKGMEWMGENLNPQGPMPNFFHALYHGIKLVGDMALGINDKLLAPFINAIKMGVTGSVSSAAVMLEEVMKKSVGLIINLFAQILELGEMADKIKEIILRFRSQIEAAIERSLSGVKHTYRHLLDKLPHN